MSASPNLFTRDDTFLGICEGLGEDLRVNPFVFRLGLALVLFWSPMAAAIAYAAMGVAVVASRLLFPARRAGAGVAAASAVALTDGNDEQEPLPLAA